MKKIISILFIVFVLNSCNQENKLTPEEAKQIAKEAYIYGFPLAINYKTMYNYVVNENSPEYKGEFNYLACDARVFTPKDKTIVTPNSDTPYCMFWGDMRTEPLVITIPEMESNRFYEFQLIDLYSHNFAYVSTIENGNVPGNYLIAGPNWKGDMPKGIDKVIRCETNFLFCVIRTQLFNSSDLERVKEIQSKYKFKPLSDFLGTPAPKSIQLTNFPDWNEGDQFDINVFKHINFMLSLTETHPSEKKLMKRLAKIGLGTSGIFDINQFSPKIQKAMEEGVNEGFAEMEAFIKKYTSDPLASGKIFGTRAFLKESAAKNYNLPNAYILRAVAAQTGIYGNSVKEAMYPTYFVDSEGQPLDASTNNYQIIFPKGQLPPVSAFWSLTMYDGKTQLLIENPLDRYLLNSTMMDQFVIEEDGSLTLYVQKESPGNELETNWLPAPNGSFYSTLRLYGPEEAALTGQWVNPPMVRVQQNNN